MTRLPQASAVSQGRIGSATGSRTRNRALDASKILPISSAAFAPKVQTLGHGIPGYQTSLTSSAKGGGAFKQITENFSANPANGTLSLGLPIRISPSRRGFEPQLALAYDSGGGNGQFGFGWDVSLPSIHRKSNLSVPLYLDDKDSFAFNGSDIVVKNDDGEKAVSRTESLGTREFHVTIFRPRVDDGNTRIERWMDVGDPSDVHWRTLTSDNRTSIYGDGDSSRIVDKSTGTRRIFSWLLVRSYDAFGNAIQYVYKEENGAGIADDGGRAPSWEIHRPHESRNRQRYIKRICYGNKTPNRDLITWEATDWPDKWMFEVVFDYGEHAEDCPSSAEGQQWLIRQDPFSQSHAGFEVRNYRLCRRILMFHHFPGQVGVAENLVSSTVLQYDESPQRTVMTGVIIRGHTVEKFDSIGVTEYTSQCLPAWSFTYTSAPSLDALTPTEAKTVNLLQLPSSQVKVSEWLDLDGEGMPGLLTKSQDGTMHYQRNTGPASENIEFQFCPPMVLRQHPNITLGSFHDLDKNGHLNYVLHDAQGHPQGFYERSDADTWSTFSDFPETPSGVDWQQTVNIDLTGNGLPDVLYPAEISDGILVWRQNLGKRGYSGPQQISYLEDFEFRPRILQTSDVRTYVADMTGSGMSDVVLVSHSSLKYWQNLGQGAFGPPVEMANFPVLGPREDFEYSRLRLIDIDGTGPSDILYLLPTGGAALYYNLAGNSWSGEVFISGLPTIIQPSSVFMLDILGRGTACLCWSDKSTDNSNKVMYLDFIGEKKPHLLESYSNGLGATTSISYSPSTKFYAEDERNGKPWTTRLPFPVHCVSKVSVVDEVTGNQDSVEHVYHNGCYDPLERQFAGFEMVEVISRERIVIGKGEVYEPPAALAKTWFNVGMALNVHERHFLTKPSIFSVFEGDLIDAEQIFTALRGMRVRTEIYGLDGTSKAGLPFSIQEESYSTKRLQARGLNRYSVVQVSPRETIDKHYDRDLDDPRITHHITLKTTPFGEVEESLHIVYPRTATADFPDVAKNQKGGNMTHMRLWFTNPVNEDRDFRKSEPWRQQEHEIVNFEFGEDIMSFEQAVICGVRELPVARDDTTTWKALRSESRAFYRGSKLSSAWEQGKLEAYSVLDQTFQLVFDLDLVKNVDRGLRSCDIPGEVDDLLVKGKYTRLKESDAWWLPSTRLHFCHPERGLGDALREARASFYCPTYSEDPFGNITRVALDEGKLLVEELQDASGNVSAFKNDYQRLKIREIIDPNLNITQAMYDCLGHPIATALIGKGQGVEIDVDSIQGLNPKASAEDLDEIRADPHGHTARRLLGKAGSLILYSFDSLSEGGSDHLLNEKPRNPSIQDVKAAGSGHPPIFTVRLTRSLSHGQSADTNVVVNISYMNGHGNLMQEICSNDSESPSDLWLMKGLSVMDSHGQVICKYQPWYSASAKPGWPSTFHCPPEITFWDTMKRQIATLAPNKTWSKLVHRPWSIVEHDAGTLILQTPESDADVGHLFTRLQSTRYSPGWKASHQAGSCKEQCAAQKSAAYADAPTITHLGSCGLPLRTIRIADGATYTRSWAYDFNGNKTHDYDSFGRLVERATYDKLGRKLQSMGMDKGDLWMLEDACGGELLRWNCRRYSFTTRYDAMRREVEKLARQGSEPEKLVTRITYGESNKQAAAELNLRQQVWKVEDQAGVHLNTRFDIRGHCIETVFQPLVQYKGTIDWTVGNDLEPAQYYQTFTYDNYGQLVERKDAKGGRTRNHFTKLGHINQVDFMSATDGTWKPLVVYAEFSADGLPMKTKYGNGVTTQCIYDDQTRDLISQRTVRESRGGQGRKDVLEDISHTYDCNGRCVLTVDSSEQVKYFSGNIIKPEREFTFNTVGRLVSATGRAQLTAAPGSGTHLCPHDAMQGYKSQRGIIDSSQLYQYLELYEYDVEGNILSMSHEPQNITGVTGWRRRFFYEEQSLLSSTSDVTSNRLSRTTIRNRDEGRYAYDGIAGRSGCVTSLPKFSELDWDMNNMLSYSSTQRVGAGYIPERTYYVYDYLGTRVRKVSESSSKNGEPRKQKDTLFVGNTQHQIRRDGFELSITRIGDEKLLAVVECSTNRQTPLFRLQIGDGMELDEDAQLVSYDEYSPFGTIVYSAVQKDVEAPRIYRFSRYEHDRETGLYYCSYRYYCPWLGRWISPDPLGDVDGPNLYEYVGSDPVNSRDPSGTSKIFSRATSALFHRSGPWIRSPWQLQSQLFSSSNNRNGSFNSLFWIPRQSFGKPKAGSPTRVEKSRSLFEATKARTASQKPENNPARELLVTKEQIQYLANKPPRGDQHHVYPQKFGHLFEAAGIKIHDMTLHVDRESHNLIGKHNDFGPLMATIYNDMKQSTLSDKDLIKSLGNRNSIESGELIEAIKSNSQKYQEMFEGKMVANLRAVGLDFGELGGSMGPYKAPTNKIGTQITFQVLHEKIMNLIDQKNGLS